MLLDSLDFLKKTKRNSSNLKVLNSSLKTISVSHAYLFSGGSPEKLFKLSLYFAASINCQNKGCGTCRVCINTLKQVYENLLIIEPVGNFITMEQVKNIQDFIKLSPAKDSFKICIIKEADSLNKEAANKLLKTLEEPPDNKSIFVLLTDNLAGMVPTISSRCIVFEWDMENSNDFILKGDTELFKEMVNNGIKNILQKSSGLDSVLDLSAEINDFLKMQLPDYVKSNHENISRFKNTGATQQETKKFESTLKAKNKKETNRHYYIGLNIVFDIITAWLEDIISVKSGAGEDFLNYSRNFSFIKENLSGLEFKDLLDLISDIENSRDYLKFSLSNELLMDNIFLSVKKLTGHN